MARGGKKCRTWSKYLSFLFHFLFLSQGPSFPPKTCSVCLSALVCRLQVGKEPTPLNDSCRWLCAWHGSKTVVALPAQTRARCSCYADMYTVVVPALSAQAMPTATCAIKTMIGLQKSTVNLAALSTALATPMLTVRKFLFWGVFLRGRGKEALLLLRRPIFR